MLQECEKQSTDARGSRGTNPRGTAEARRKRSTEEGRNWKTKSSLFPGPALSSGLRFLRASAVTFFFRSDRQVPEREQGVVDVLAVGLVVVPRADEGAPGPERIDEVEAALAHGIDRDVEQAQRVQRGRGREQVGQRCVDRGEEPAGGMGARDQPVADAPIAGLPELAQDA